MAYTLNDYHQYRTADSTRIEVYSSNNVAASLLSSHKADCAALEMSTCVSEDAGSLPMPNEIFNIIDEKIKAARKRVVVTGIDAYLSLLSEENVNLFFTALRTRIDEGKLNAVYMMSAVNNPMQHFSNPKYRDSLDIIEITEDVDLFELPKIDVVSSKWVNAASNPVSYRQLLKKLEQSHSLTENHVLCLDNLHSKQAGLSENVVFY